MELTPESFNKFKTAINIRNWLAAIKSLPEGAEKWILEEKLNSGIDEDKFQVIYALGEIWEENGCNK